MAQVVDPNNTTHTIEVIPRYYDFTGAALTLTNLAKDFDQVVTHTESTTNGVLSIEFDFTFTERDKYTVKLEEGTDVVYRGQLFATDQESQDFDITVNYLTY